MNRKQRVLLFLKISCIGIAFLLMRSCAGKRQDVYQSDNEIVTLTHWDTQTTDKLVLDLNLLFYWKQWPLDNQGVFNKDLLAKPDTIQSTSAVWTRKGYAPKGFGTYRFFIKQNHTKNSIVLNMSRVLGACDVWVNGKKLTSHGTLSKNLEDSQDAIPALVAELPKEDVLDVMLLVSNTNSRLGGGFPLQNSINEKDSFYLIKKRKIAFESLITLLLIIFGMYQIFIYKSIHKEKLFLFFGLFCLFGGGRQLFVGEVFIYRIFPEISFEIVQRLRYICFYAGLAFVFLYHHYLFPGYFSKKVVLFSTCIPSLGILYVLLTPIFYGTYSVLIFRVFGVFIMICGFWLVIKAIKDEKPFAKLVLYNLIILSVLFTNDILNAMMLRQTGFFMNIGLLAYVIFQIYLNNKIVKQKEEKLLSMALEIRDMNAQIEMNKAKISKLLHESYYHLKSKRELADNLTKIKHEDDAMSIHTIVKNLRSELLEDNQLNVIKNDIEILNYDYLQRLKVKAPNLTETDIEICSYIYIGLNRNEISRLRNTTIEAIRKSRYRIRKKLGLDIDEELEAYLKNI